MNTKLTLLTLCFLTAFAYGQLSAQAVFTKVYDARVKGQNIEWDGNRLIVAGDLHFQNQTDFSFMKLDTTGTVVRSVGYHHTGRDHASFIRNHPNGGYVIGGYSLLDPTSPDSSEIVILRLAANGALQWARSYYKANHKAGVISGLEINGDGTIVFSAHMYIPLTASGLNMHGTVVQLDTAGNIMWHRAVRLGNALVTPNPLLIDGPNSNLAIQNNGTIIAGWNFFRYDSTTNVISKGISVQALDNTGNLVWEKQYKSRPMLAMELTPSDNGLAIYLSNLLGAVGLIKLDANGDQLWGRLDPFATNSNIPRVSLKASGNQIAFQTDNRITIERNNPMAIIRPSIASTTPHLRVRDFVTSGKKAYILAHTLAPAATPNSVGFRPTLTKSIIDTVANCFFSFHPSANYPAFSLDTLSVNLSSTNTLPLFMDSLSLPQVLLSTYDSTVCVGQGLVWPGDANSDGIANVLDFMFVGLGWGKNGAPRLNPTLQWVGQTALDWNFSFFNGVNMKHADGNGNGHIGWFDIVPIVLNYGLTHNKGEDNGGPDDPPLFLEMPQDSIEVGQTLTIPIMYGDSAHPVEDVYALGFSIRYDPALIDTNSMHFTPAVSWMGTDSVDLIYMEKDFPVEGQLEVGLTRVTQTDASGYGMIGALTFVTIDNISGKTLVAEKLRLEIVPQGAINTLEQRLPVFGKSDSVVVTQETSTSIKDNLISGEVKVYPNPVFGLLEIDGGNIQTEEVILTDLLGREVIVREINKTRTTLDMGEITPGIYVLKGKTREGYWMKRLIVR
ncbi:MAG: T9SS type A sorting domain-containing protein [Bacteroidia bacterium]|nr:T9SS type A sorting domain-containing protein [Bacteroidia bacterium]